MEKDNNNHREGADGWMETVSGGGGSGQGGLTTMGWRVPGTADGTLQAGGGRACSVLTGTVGL